MTRETQSEFIRDLTRNVLNDILDNKLPRMPEAWDGHELRKYVAERFAEADLSRLMTGKRLREYRNEVLVRNL